MNCTKALVQWCKRYDIKVGRVSFDGYTSCLPSDIGGRCYYYYMDYQRNARIKIHEKIKNRCFLTKVALWHEFCHAELFIKKGETGHNYKWYLKTIRKPILFLGQLYLIYVWRKM